MAKRKRLTPARIDQPGDEFPTDLETKSMFGTYPQGVWTPPRRAPIADVAHDAATTAALAEVSSAMEAARAEGRLIVKLPLDAIEADYLVRDRMEVDETEMQVLLDSLTARGQQTAIEVTELGTGRYGLISGWRRLKALRHLAANGVGTETVLAIIRSPREQADAYLAMVEENEIRAGLSFYERARIVVRAAEAGVYPSDRTALAGLFAAASRSKRSKIGSFVRIVRALDPALHYPSALSERAGLALAQAIETDPGLVQRLFSALATRPASAEDEAAIIAAAIAPQAVPVDTAAPLVASAPRTTGSSPAPRAEPDPHAVELRPGLRLRETASGLLISGYALKDDYFKERLIAFLSDPDSV